MIAEASIYESALQRAWEEEHSRWLDSKRVGQLGEAFAVPRNEYEQRLIEQRSRDLGRLKLYPLLHDGRAADCDLIPRPRLTEWYWASMPNVRRCHACRIARRDHDAGDEDRS